MKIFFTEDLGFDEAFYDEHKLIFFCLIFNAKFNLKPNFKDGQKIKQSLDEKK